MFRTRFEITGELSVRSPLHIGSGRTVTREAVSGKKGEPPPEIAALVRDVRGRPFLPGTTLKGLLRRIGESALDQADCEGLFGVIRETSQGAIGALIVRGAAETAHGNAHGMPYADGGVFVVARTRVDRHSGTADDNSLHFTEMVAPDARFGLRLLLEPLPSQDGDKMIRDLIGVLSELCNPAGVAIGRGQTDGFGRVQLDLNKVEIKRLVLNKQGDFAAQNATAVWHKNKRPARVAGANRVKLVLTCDGPFVVLDPSHLPQHDAAGNPTGPQLKAQGRSGKALLLGSSLSGALRNRAAWLEALRRHKGGQPVTSSREIDDMSRRLPASDGPASLTAVERVFGVTGFRGLLEIAAIEVTKGAAARFASVKLDRFSGAPIDNALFETETFVGTEVTVTIGLAARPKLPIEKADSHLFKTIVEDILKNGIVLGHGGGKGFGWFSVRRE